MMTLSKFIHLLREHIITYHIMRLNLKNTSFQTTNLDINVVPMKPDDTMKFSSEYFGDYWHEKKRNALLQHNPHYEGYTYYDAKNTLLGYCWIMRKGSSYDLFHIKHADAYISKFFINKQFRGQGLESKMLISVCHILNNKGIHDIQLAVRSYNKSAIRCYEKSGFEYIKKHTIFKLPKHGIALPHFSI